MTRRLTWAFLICGAVIGSAAPAGAAGYTVVGWNNLGMHCTDADFSVLSLLPPYNTIHAQVIDPAGLRVKDPVAAGITVTYEAILDSTGSINTTSQGKTNFWQYVLPLFGVAPSVDVGLTGLRMPGVGNVPQPMTWDPTAGWFIAEGIPIVPYDDAHQKNPYPMMRLVARTTGGAMLAFTLSLDDFVISFFTSGPSSVTLPLYIYGSLRRGISPDIHALSTIVFLVTVALVLGLQVFTRSPKEE